MTPSEIIEAIGSERITAELQVSAQMPRHWRRRGIPSRYWLPLARLAGTLMLGISIDTIAASSPKRSHRS